MDSHDARKKILVCDDDTAITDMMVLLLGYHGFDVIPVLNSPDIFEKIAVHRPDLIYWICGCLLWRATLYFYS